MKNDDRVKLIQDILDNKEPFSYKHMAYKGKSEKMPVYQIPVEYLVFNQYNGRIGTFIKTYEKLHGPVVADSEEGEKIIVDFLWRSAEKRNKATMESLKENGQQEYGIVTKDGVVIDGNRRCMLIKKIAEKNSDGTAYFLGVILDETLGSNPKEIRKLETTYQMGVDEKVDYSPIEKYLKCQDLSLDFTNDSIAKMMGEKESDIEKYLEILNLLEEYLKVCDAEGMYTRLEDEKVEGPFVDLRNYLSQYEKGRVVGRNWTPKKTDINELKDIYFDYIRAGMRTADGVRAIGNPAKDQGFFSRKEVWENFKNTHFENVEDVVNNERTLASLMEERPGESPESISKARDYDFKGKVVAGLKKNLGLTGRKLEDLVDSGQPLDLLQKALTALESIDTSVDDFISEEVFEYMDKIRQFSDINCREIKKKLRD